MAKRIEHIFDDSGIELKRCSSCHEYLPLENFNPCKTRWDKLHHKCKICDSKYGCQYHKDNPEKNNENQKRFRENNREHSQKYKRIYNANKRASDPDFKFKEDIRELTRRLIKRAIKEGAFTWPTECELCQFPSDRLQIHHHTYDINNPVDIAILCVACHLSVHRQLKLENPMFSDDDIDQEETSDWIADNIAAIDFYDSDCGHA